MKGDKKVIGHLNTVLKNELTAINQYFLHSRMLDNWGIHKMARHEYKESIEEMQHADRVIQRVLMLDGLPNLQDLGKLMIGENVKEVIECDLKLEIIAVADLRAAIKDCESVQDYVTRDLFIGILRDEENHIDHLETQLQMIKDQGLENFIQLQSEAELPNHA
jgi:bacterioferritin